MKRPKKRPAPALRRPARALPVEPGQGDGDDASDASWFEQLQSADLPDWASHCLRVLMPSFVLLKERLGDRIRIV